MKKEMRRNVTLILHLDVTIIDRLQVYAFFLFSLCQAGEYVDMVKAGILDPLKVVRTALVDAARWI